MDGERNMATVQELEARKMRGQAIAQVESNVRRIDANEYRVKSQSGHGNKIGKGKLRQVAVSHRVINK